jgi:signal transduction histidine kinase
MEKQVRLLFVEDSPEDAEILQRDLQKGGLDFVSNRVQTREQIIEALRELSPDLVISDYTLPRLDGMTALRTVREIAPQVPFIFVSGTIGEERAIEALKGGATDYVLKDRRGALVAKVQRALREVEDRERQRRLELELHQAQKMEAVGRLAGGVAHDFNNLLTVIAGYTDLMLAQANPGALISEGLQEIMQATQRATALTRHLVAFSRSQVLAPAVLNLNHRVKEMEKMLRSLGGESVKLETRLDPALGNVRADPTQVDQIIMNLAVNARDAMPRGGKLVIETANVQLDEAYVQGHPGSSAGPHIRLTVSDTGTGMSAETKAHIFEPFFTTKEPGKGTGLGLPTVYGIVRQSGGSIDVQSELGRGTAMVVHLPRVEDRFPSSRRLPVVDRAPTGSETILVVEDSEPLRKLLHSTLEKQGYTVLSAPDGVEALRMAEDYNGQIHLLVTDVVMPRKSGTELASELVLSRPGVRVLYTSGSVDWTGSKAVDLGSKVAFLAKPFTPGELGHKVRDILGIRAGGKPK